VTNQAVWTSDLLYSMRVLLFITLLCVGYSLSQPNSTGSDKEQDLLLRDTTEVRPSLSPWQRQASDKAIAKYAESQDKKWRRWNEAMFERSG
jgi:hypothetical protein